MYRGRNGEPLLTKAIERKSGEKEKLLGELLSTGRDFVSFLFEEPMVSIKES